MSGPCNLFEKVIDRIRAEYKDKTDFTKSCNVDKYEGWNFNNGNYLFTTDTK